jgi:hypothetical protein
LNKWQTHKRPLIWLLAYAYINKSAGFLQGIYHFFLKDGQYTSSQGEATLSWDKLFLSSLALKIAL